jgi:16S rRNA (uracil1498-N3)-methyltransferase
MSAYDFKSPRLYVEAPLRAGATVSLDRAQAHYLTHVLRLKAGQPVLLFNGRDGEWRGSLEEGGKRGATLAVTTQTRVQTGPGDLHYLFVPLKSARLDYMVQKAVEMGVSLLQPVSSQHGQVARINVERMRANAIEAAEQCGILSLPEIAPPVALTSLATHLAGQREAGRWLIFCDEEAETANPVEALQSLPRGEPLAVLIGPEGGFAEEERALLLKLPNVLRLSLGPRILRADTAAVAALTAVQSVLGDWR